MLLLPEEMEMMEQDYKLESLAEEMSNEGASPNNQRFLDSLQFENEEQMHQEQQFEGSDGVSSRPFTAADAEEMNTIIKTNKIFDRWLRNVVS